MTNFVRAVALQLGRAELERIANALLAAGQLTDEEARPGRVAVETGPGQQLRR
jgi:hypothetical protein